jgi:hypothetical protein
VPDRLQEFAKWLVADQRVIEVWGAQAARVARFECVADEAQSLELDSGDWFLVRVSGLPTTPEPGGIIRFRRLAEVRAVVQSAATTTADVGPGPA